MAKRRFQSPKPFKEGNFWWLRVWDTNQTGSRERQRIKLAPADLSVREVQKIAEAFLLWNGNHSWKVLNAKPDGDVIGFDLATADGSVIAHFTMDPKTSENDSFKAPGWSW